MEREGFSRAAGAREGFNRANLNPRDHARRADRLRLRPFQASDIDAYAANVAPIRRSPGFLGDGSPLTREDAWRQMAMLAGHWHLRVAFGMWAVEENPRAPSLGGAGLFLSGRLAVREVGWTLAREYWGRGYSFTKPRASCAYAFDVLRDGRGSSA